MAERDEERRWALFVELAETGSSEARNELVESYAPLAEYFANRYRHRASEPEDLRQVARLALVKAVDRFDPGQSVAFSTFAGRTIEGEIKRFFRDQSWAVRVPRSLQEATLAVRDAADELAVENGRPATVEDLMQRTGYEADLVLEALDARSALQAQSIDRPTLGLDTKPTMSSTLGDSDADLERIEARVAMDKLIKTLPPRERRIIELRFYENRTQQQIADEIGVSQMHISRLLRAALAALRDHLVGS